MTGTLALDGERLLINGGRINVPSFESAHLLPGQSDWWNPTGIVGGFFTNLDPDDNPVGQPNAPGARGALWAESGSPDMSMEVTWAGNHGAGAGPMVCIDPDQTEWGLSFYLEDFTATLGTWLYILWNIGRQPNEISIVASGPAPTHVDGTPVDLRIDVRGSDVTCYADDVLQLTSTVPANLVGATKYGVSVDVNGATPREPNLECAPYPAIYKGI